MNTKQLVKKLGIKLLGKKPKPAADMQLPANGKTQSFALVDRLGGIQLHEHWRN